MQNNIRLLRKERGWSMRELGDRMGAHFSTIAKLEKSERKLTREWAAKFATAFDVNIWDVTDADAYALPNPHESSLPILPLSRSKEWKDVRLITKEHLPPADGRASDLAFYVNIDTDIADDLFPNGSFVLVDPEQRDLEETHAYAILVEDKNIRFVGYRSSPPHFEACGRESRETVLTLGHTPFVTMGKILGVYIAMSQ